MQLIARDDLLLILLAFTSFGYGLTACLLLLAATRLRQARVAQWVDRITRLQEDPDAEKGLEVVRQLDPVIGSIVSRAHEASVRHRTLNAINRRINSSMQIEVVLPEIIKSAVELLRGTSGSVTLRDREGACQNIAVYNLPLEVMHTHIPKSHSVAAETVRRGEPVIVEDYFKYEGRLHLLDAYGFKAVLGIPLGSEGQIIGALIVTSSDPSRRFGQADVELLSSLADQAALAIKNASLYSENLRRMEELQHAKKELGKRTTQLRGLLSRTFQSEEEIRRRIAADIHDGIAQLVVGALCQIRSVKPLIASEMHNNSHVADNRLEVAQSLLNQTLAEMYNVIHDLRPPYLDEIGLVPALQRYLENFREVSGLECRIEVIGSERRLEPDKQVAIYRIMQEALSNLRKHSGAPKADVFVQFHSDKVAIRIHDNGKGFDKALSLRGDGEHLGIAHMEERAYSVGGSLHISSAPGHGTTVLLEVPITPQEPATAESRRAVSGVEMLAEITWPNPKA